MLKFFFSVSLFMGNPPYNYFLKVFERFLPLSHFLYILYHKNFFAARNANSAHFSHILKHSCSFHVKTRCRHVQRRCSFLEDIAFTPCFLSLARRLAKLYLHFQFRAGAGLPHAATGQQPAVHRGDGFGKISF